MKVGSLHIMYTDCFMWVYLGAAAIFLLGWTIQYVKVGVRRLHKFGVRPLL
jgi:hypothetical protein